MKHHITHFERCLESIQAPLQRNYRTNIQPVWQPRMGTTKLLRQAAAGPTNLSGCPDWQCQDVAQTQRLNCPATTTVNDLPRTSCEEPLTIRELFFGDIPSSKQEGVFRIHSLNIGGLPVDDKDLPGYVPPSTRHCHKEMTLDSKSDLDSS